MLHIKHTRLMLMFVVKDKLMKKKVLMTYRESGMGHITSIKSISDNFKALYGDEFEVIDSYIMQEDHDKRLKKFEDFIITKTKKSTYMLNHTLKNK